MKVILTKKAEFEFNEEKYTKIPNNVFNAIAGVKEEEESHSDENLPEVVVFNTMIDYINNKSKYNIDTEKPVHVSEKGIIFAFI